MSRNFMTDADRPDVARFIERHWGSSMILSGGQVYYPHLLEGLLERRDGELVALLTFRTDGGSMELLTLNSTLEGKGIGSSLMLTVIDEGRKRGIKRIWLSTTNDNLRAVGFYQRLGFRIVGVHVGMVDEARKIKPQIPEIGRDGIPIHDELILELRVQPYSDG